MSDNEGNWLNTAQIAQLIPKEIHVTDNNYWHDKKATYNPINVNISW